LALKLLRVTVVLRWDDINVIVVVVIVDVCLILLPVLLLLRMV